MALAQYVAAVLASSPRAYWQMQEASGNPQDSSGNALHMTSISAGADYREPGPIGAFAIRFTGGEGVSRATISTVVNNFTLEQWVQVQVVTGNDMGLCANGNLGANGWGVLIDTTRKFQYLAGGVALGANSALALTLSAWHHVAVVRRAGTWEYYVDGTVDTANAGTTAPNAPSGGTTAANGGSSLQAAYAHYAVYETALSAAAIAAHFAAATAAAYDNADVVADAGYYF